MDKIAGERFHAKRTLFVWIKGALKVNTDPNDDRDHLHWVTEDYGITVEKFEELPMGYMLPGSIQLFKGRYLKELSKDEWDRIVPRLKDLLNAYKSTFNGDDFVSEVSIFNGVRVGRIGNVWPPKSTILTLEVSREEL